MRVAIVVGAITWGLWIKMGSEIWGLAPFLALSQIAGLEGIVMMAMTVILSSRSRVAEMIAGGIDKAYKQHHQLGKISFFLILGHPLFKIINNFPEYKRMVEYVIPGKDGIVNLGIFAFYGLIVLVGLSVTQVLPYHKWFKSHRLMGMVVFLAGGHVALIESSAWQMVILKGWILVWIALAWGAIIWRQSLYKYWGPKHQFKVSRVKNWGAMREVWLVPEKQFKFWPGQFGFFEVGKHRGEIHPFTIASAPKENEIRLAIKKLGDYTDKLEIKAGEKVIGYGPYGSFGEGFEEETVVAIAGGIGITPFLSLIENESKSPKKRRIFLFYAVKTKKELFFNQEIKELEKKLKNLKVYRYISDESQRLTIGEVRARVGTTEANFYICGPKGMMDMFRAGLIKEGVKPQKIYLEDFNWR
jgi:predicted ferric reductase